MYPIKKNQARPCLLAGRVAPDLKEDSVKYSGHFQYKSSLKCK